MKVKNLLLFYCYCLFFGGCGTKSTNSTVSNSSKMKIIDEECDTISISYGEYYLQLNTDLLKDSLSGAWTDDIYGSPIVLWQDLHFFKNGKEIRTIEGPEETTMKTTSNHGNKEVKNIVLFDLCSIVTENRVFFEVSGSGFCHGVTCPEYYAVFSPEGEILCEQISTSGPTGRGRYNSCLEIKNGFLSKAHKSNNCQSILKLWVPR